MPNCYILQEDSWREFGRRRSSTRSKEVQMPGDTSNLEAERRRKTLPKLRRQASRESRTHTALLEKMTSRGDLNCTIGFSALKQLKMIYHIQDLETVRNQQSGKQKPTQVGPQQLNFAFDLRLKICQHQGIQNDK